MFETCLGCRSISAEPLEHLPEDAAVLQALELVGEQELVEKDVADVGGELGDVVDQVLVQLAGVLPFEASRR